MHQKRVLLKLMQQSKGLQHGVNDQTSRWGSVQQPGNCQMPGCCMQNFVNCSYRFAVHDVLTKVHLQECFTANNSKNKPDIDVISAQRR